MIEIDAVGILLVRLDPLGDSVLDIVHGLRVARGPVLRAALAAKGREPQLVGDAVHAEIEENRGGRAVSVGGLAQQGPNARDGRKAGSGSAHDNVSLRSRAFSSEVGTGSREENASKLRDRAFPFRSNRNGKALEPEGAPAARLNPGCLRQRTIVSYRIVAGVYRGLLAWVERRLGRTAVIEFRLLRRPVATATIQPAAI
jgi:hypothetical protein